VGFHRGEIKERVSKARRTFQVSVIRCIEERVQGAGQGWRADRPRREEAASDDGVEGGGDALDGGAWAARRSGEMKRRTVRVITIPGLM
jgi:hypothetical protein